MVGAFNQAVTDEASTTVPERTRLAELMKGVTAKAGPMWSSTASSITGRRVAMRLAVRFFLSHSTAGLPGKAGRSWWRITPFSGG
ncbi:hypothetical protein DSCA_22590 [Desulfosarcina alkanivorans]|uniref:Uncharacterized protein n=1 Tax=Desulfosarcina alkanivorans TaxID=571177 RepID=A0A5K7YKD1_9BACT|nr:hypothetical protein DSCA_22590 [Desulfosarcina alkanivorans]